MIKTSVWKHLAVTIGGVFLILGIPFLVLYLSPSFSGFGGDIDATSSASTLAEKPSGNYLILMNKKIHTSQEDLDTWTKFFREEDYGVLFDDISCDVVKSDAGAIALAKNFQSRLSEGQMKLRAEDGILLVSRADHLRFDLIIMSQEYADSVQAETGLGPDVFVIKLRAQEGEHEKD